mgnify:CR=1 FL=1
MKKSRIAAAAALAAALLFVLSACKKTQDVSQPKPEDVPAGQSEESAGDDWKADFEKSLLENYGVTPDHYEDLGDGIYQVYVEMDGKVIPFVAVDSTTGDYHG